MNLYLCKYVSPLGDITMASDGEALTGLWFDGQKYFPQLSSEYIFDYNIPVFIQARKWLDAYFRGINPGEIPPVHLKGSSFRILVWDILQAVPYGKSITYSDIARQIAIKMRISKMSAQAVGGAVSHNPISIIVPCHRVIGAKGDLTGYAGGLQRKIKLLRIEHTDFLM